MHYKLQIESIFILAELSQHTSYELPGHPSHGDTIGGINDKILLKQTKCFIIPVKWAIVEVSGGDILHIWPGCKWPAAGRVRYIIGGDVRSCQLRLGEARSLAMGKLWDESSVTRSICNHVANSSPSSLTSSSKYSSFKDMSWSFTPASVSVFSDRWLYC